MEISSIEQRTKPIAISDNDFAEENEPQPNSNEPQEVTTTPINATKDTNKEEHRTQMEEPTPKPTRNDPNYAPTEPVLITRREDDNMGTCSLTEHGEEGNVEIHKPVEQNNEALMDVTLSPDQDI